MSESRRKETRKERFLKEHPYCCFCGGVAKTETWDHVPPKACFPKGHWPETFEFPACHSCNSATRDNDAIFGYHTMLLDYDESNLSIADARRLHRGIANNYPEGLPRLELSANEIRNALRHANVQKPDGMPLKDTPVALISTEARDSIIVAGRKLGCALYYRECGLIASSDFGIWISWHQVQSPDSAEVTDYLIQALPDFTKADRGTIQSYGDRFCYWSGETDGLFVYAVIFGRGLMIWGVVAPVERLRQGDETDDWIWPIFGPAAEHSTLAIVDA